MPIAQSTHLQSYDYDTNSQTLTVTFQDGSVYQYPGVTLQDYTALANAGGSGQVFWASIRNKYPATKISGSAR